MERPFYNAPDFLEHLFTLNDPNASYDFDDVILVCDTRDGKIYAAQDSGCSCPTPFENHRFPTDFTEIRSVEDFRNFVKAEARSNYTPRDLETAEACLNSGPAAT